MAGKSNNTAAAVGIQSVADTMETLSSADYFPISQLRPAFTSVQAANDEYTGSPVKNADTVSGSKKAFSFNVKIRGPGTLPAANAWEFGRIMQALGFTEVRVATAIPASPEAVAGSGQTTTNLRLGTSGSTTAGLYKGYPIIISDKVGSGYLRKLSQIAAYDGSKNATLPETLANAAAANYQIPTFIGYMRGISSTDPVQLSMQFWLDGLRYDLKNARPTSAQLVFPTSTRDNAAYPELQVTVEGILNTVPTAEATPPIPSLGAIPLFKNGDMWLNQVKVGGSTFTIDLGIGTENPPNPNQADGSDAPEIVSATAKISQTRQRYLPSVIDTLALAESQAYVPFWAQYGAAAGATVQVLAPQVRLAHPTPDLGGGTINESGDMLVDAIDRAICLTFPC